MKTLGIDIGGSGMKGAVVDTATGKFVTDRYRLKTPDGSTPDAMAEAVAKIVEHFLWKGRVGCAMPGPIKHGKVMTANNLDKSWVGAEAGKIYGRACGRAVAVINDADAAGIAEMRFGAGRNRRGVVLIITLGTGIGSALFVDGRLVPNTELGQIELGGKEAEELASSRARKERDWSWRKWAKHVDLYVRAVEELTWPDLIIIGGGVSRKAHKFIPRIRTKAKVVPAKLRNEAGIVGAALGATGGT
jgi:polyphosphate glucokinase